VRRAYGPAATADRAYGCLGLGHLPTRLHVAALLVRPLRREPAFNLELPVLVPGSARWACGVQLLGWIGGDVLSIEVRHPHPALASRRCGGVASSWRAALALGLSLPDLDHGRITEPEII
jgi:hypothetical protein